MTGELLLYGAIALAGLALSALYSGMETGLYTINRVRLAVRASHGERAAERLRRFIDRPNRMLSTLLLGNNIANYAGSFGIAAILDAMGVSPLQAVAINAGILVPILFIFGETLPKDLFRTFTDRWSYRFAGFLTWSSHVLMWIGLIPIVQSFGAVLGRLLGADPTAARTARQRISQLIYEGVGAGVLTESQTSLVDRALAMRDLRVVDEMVPWRNVAWLPIDAPDSQRRALFRRHGHTRVPVVDADGTVVGVLSMLDVVQESQVPTAELLQPAIFIDPATRVRQAVQQMQAQRGAMGIVIAPGAKAPVGLVTFTDLVEPLTGELEPW